MFARTVFRAGRARNHVFRPPRQQQYQSRSYASGGPLGGIAGWPLWTKAAAAVAAVPVGLWIFQGAYIYFFNDHPVMVWRQRMSDETRESMKDVPEFFRPPGTDTGGMVRFLKGGDQGWVTVKLESVEDVTHNTKKFRFALPDPDMVSGVYTTSAILTKVQKPGEKPVVRPYTPINANNQKGRMELLVKKYEGGPMSTHLHSMKPGDELEVKGPLPKYWWYKNKHKHVAMVAGGTGIAPMWQLIYEIFADPWSQTSVTLVLGNIKEEDILMKRQLRNLENVFPKRLRVFHALDQPQEGWKGHKGHITKDLLKEVLPEPRLGEECHIFVCGPPGLMEVVSGKKQSPKEQGEVKGILKELGYSKEQVYKF